MIWLLALIALGWLSLVGGLVLAQRRLLYRPIPAPNDPQRADAPWMTAIHEQGRLLGWWTPPPRPDAPVMVFFHGNRGTLARVAAKTRPWVDDFGIGLFAATYRGFEGNPGPATEQGLYADSRAVLAWLDRQGFDRSKLILYGESLGSGVAVQMALESPVAALVLEAPFTSIPAMAAARYPYAPAHWLVRDRFDNLGKIGRLRQPILILHGTADHTTDIGHSRRLKAAAPEIVSLREVKDATHLDIHQKGGGDFLAAFLVKTGQIHPRAIAGLPDGIS